MVQYALADGAHQHAGEAAVPEGPVRLTLSVMEKNGKLTGNPAPQVNITLSK